MALIECQECGERITGGESVCVKCGCPIVVDGEKEVSIKSVSAADSNEPV